MKSLFLLASKQPKIKKKEYTSLGKHLLPEKDSNKIERQISRGSKILAQNKDYSVIFASCFPSVGFLTPCQPVATGLHVATGNTELHQADMTCCNDFPQFLGIRLYLILTSTSGT